MAQTAPPAMVEGETEFFVPPGDDKFQFEMSGHSASAGGNHDGSRMKLTSQRLMWQNTATNQWTSVPLTKVTSQEMTGGMLRSWRLHFKLESGATVDIKSKNSDNLTKLDNGMKQCRNTLKQAAAAAAQPATPAAAAVAAPTAARAVPAQKQTQLEATSTKLDKEIEKLDDKISKCDEDAKAEIKKGTPSAKSKAMNIIKRKKMYEKQRETYVGQQFNVDSLQMAQEQAEANKMAVQAMQQAQSQMAAQNKVIGIDQVDKLRDDMEDTLAEMQEVNEALSGPIGDQVDEDEFAEEFARIAAEEQAKQAQETEAALLQGMLDSPAVAPLPARVPGVASGDDADVLAALAALSADISPASVPAAPAAVPAAPA